MVTLPAYTALTARRSSTLVVGRTVQLPDPGDGIEGVRVSSDGNPQVFASPLGVDNFDFIAVPASGPPRINVMSGVEIPWSYNFGLASTGPGIALGISRLDLV